MKLIVEIPNTTNLERIIAYLVGEGAILSEEAQKNAIKAQRQEELLAGIREGMRLLSAKRSGKNVQFQSVSSLLDELD
ncbi:MAG: hypothetical protein RI894_2413 [Bacteroidota bacterium]|jgi:hypothetical protein